jgi:hypothetical protein
LCRQWQKSTAACAVLVDALFLRPKAELAWNRLISTKAFDPDSWSVELWAEVPQPVRKIVEQHVAAHLPAKTLAKLRYLHARKIPTGSDGAFFHFGGGMVVRNLCRQLAY